MSRWTRPREWATSRAAATWLEIRPALGPARARRRVISSLRRSGPSIRSMVTNSRPSSSPAWWIGTTFGCRSETAIRDSELEALAERVVGGEVGGDHLERDDVVEHQVRRAVDGPHAAAAGDPLDPMAGEDCAPGVRSAMRRVIDRDASRRRCRPRTAGSSGQAAPIADDRGEALDACGCARPDRSGRPRRSAGRSPTAAKRSTRSATSASVPISEVASTSSSGIASKASSRLPSRNSDCTSQRLLLEAEAAGEVDVEVRLAAAHAAEVEQQRRP